VLTRLVFFLPKRLEIKFNNSYKLLRLEKDDNH
jgi:hypothetical protein